MKKICYLSILIFLLFSCKTESENQLLVINPEEALNENVYLSEIATDITYIPLSNDKLLSNIEAIDLYNGIWFVHSYDNCICLYDQNGKLISKLDHKGKGPSEYEYISSFTVDEKNKIIYINSRNNILSYDYSGNFIKRFQTKEIFPVNIHYQDNKLFLFSIIRNGETELNWLITDPLGNEISRKKNCYIKPYNTKVVFIGKPFFKYNKNIHYWNILNDTVFSIQDNRYSTSYLIAKGDFRMTENGINMEQVNSIFAPISFIETRNYLILETFYRGTTYHMLIYKSNNKSYFINDQPNSLGFLNDCDGGVNFVPIQRITLQGNEFLVGHIQALDLITSVASNAFKTSTPKYPEKKRELEKLANSLNENDNPVLMLVKLKE